MISAIELSEHCSSFHVRRRINFKRGPVSIGAKEDHPSANSKQGRD
jgi:hypothetical protein